MPQMLFSTSTFHNGGLTIDELNIHFKKLEKEQPSDYCCSHVAYDLKVKILTQWTTLYDDNMRKKSENIG